MNVVVSHVEMEGHTLYEAGGILGGTYACLFPPRDPLQHGPAFIKLQGYVLCWGEVSFWWPTTRALFVGILFHC